MKQREAIELINLLERKYPVDKWIFGGVHIWPVIRIKLIISIFSTVYERGSGSRQSKMIVIRKIFNSIFNKSKFAFYKLLYSKKWNSDPFTEKIDVLFLSNPFHRANIDGVWFNRFCDGFIDILSNHNIKSRLYETSFNGIYYKNNYNSDLRCEIFYPLLNFSNSIVKHADENTELALYNHFLNDVHEYFGVKVSNAVEWVTIAPYIYKVLSYASFFEKLLKSVRPKLSFCVCYYGPEALGLNIACHRMNIPVVDIQHGVQGDYHGAYGSWQNVPLHGYEMLPTVFWNWDSLDSDAIKKWAGNNSKHTTYVGGNPWTTVWHKNNNLVSESMKTELKSIFLDSESPCYVLFSLQAGLPNPFPVWLIEAIRDSPSNFKWWLRFHPRGVNNENEIRSLLSKVDQNKYEIDISSKLPLPLLLFYTTVHVTYFSSVVKEAEEYGVKSIVLDAFANDLYKDQIANGNTFLILDETPNYLIEKIISIVKSYCNDNKSKVNDNNGFLDFVKQYL